MKKNRVKRIEPAPGQESVWDYPRPPRVEKSEKHIRVIFNGQTIADTRAAKRVLETSHPPVYYIPMHDVRIEFLEKTTGSSVCEWKGKAHYYSVVVNDARAERAAWTYPQVALGFEQIRDHIAFYPTMMDCCMVDDELVQPQPGGFYGGWITSDIVGPFKGGPDTFGW